MCIYRKSFSVNAIINSSKICIYESYKMEVLKLYEYLLKLNSYNGIDFVHRSFTPHQYIVVSNSRLKEIIYYTTHNNKWNF